MSKSGQQLFTEAQKLPPAERLELAELLLASCKVGPGDGEAEFIEELDRRWQAFESGEDPGVDAITAIEEMRQELRKARGA